LPVLVAGRLVAVIGPLTSVYKPIPVGDGPVAHPVKREPIKIIEKMCFLFVMGLVHYKLIENLPSENVRTVI
ncbi:TPA_asm: hypothetical protein G0D24_06180, partial [Salmonella enterica subsp. enterica serovar Abortusovis]|nr:hypothetical protein [Salmonella enterica subsp. enterica serovar Abortusovis]